MSRGGASLVHSTDVSESVRKFYDHFPYPPPVDNLEKYKERWQDRERRRAEFHLCWPYRAYREDQSILVAGCGTSQAAKHAIRWPAAQVTGIDISATSVHRTEQLKNRYSLDNLEVHQLALERVSDLGMMFDHIVCTGVLHHLENPAMGLSALRDVLKRDGAMQLMVYAPYGRAGIYMLQEFCRRIGIRACDGEVRHLIGAIGSLPAGHPLQYLLHQAADFQDESAVADALLHPQDRAYSVPQLFDFIREGKLTFSRWIRQAPYSVYCGAIAKIPQAEKIRNLTLAEQYAAAELFRGTMVRHSFVVHRNDGEEASKQQVRFGGDAWLSYIPIRTPDTICIQERLPPEVAAVLINRAHSDRDLFLPISSAEKIAFEGIDGVCSIGQIVQKMPSWPHGSTTLDLARAFFERLWWHDQIVFDCHRGTESATTLASNHPRGHIPSGRPQLH